MMEQNNAAVVDLELVLNSYNRAAEQVGDPTRFKMDDEFFTAFMLEVSELKRDGIEIESLTLTEA